MTTPGPTLKQLLIHDLPPGFVRALLERVEHIYADSYAAMLNDPSLGEEQAKYVLGYYRRGQGETVLMNTAVEHGLRATLVQPTNGGCKHVYVSAGGLALTMCHVETAGGFPKFSESREQSSKLNEHISQIELFPVVSVSDLVNETLYGVLVHTEQPRSKGAFGSLYIGFPTPEFDDWMDEPINLQDIRDIQERLYRGQEDIHAQLQDTTPTWKEINATSTKEEG